MKNDDKKNIAKDHLKEILYIEMIHQQMETFIDIDKLLETRAKISSASKYPAS